jgi:hypothetical protein
MTLFSPLLLSAATHLFLPYISLFFYQSASEYSADFKLHTGVDPEYVGAGAAASAYVLGLAIQQYYLTAPHKVGECLEGTFKTF